MKKFWGEIKDPIHGYIYITKAEKEIIDVIERVHSLISGSILFSSTENMNKCRACRLQDKCCRVGHKADSHGGPN